MFQCMNCNEMVGNNVKTCPFCIGIWVVIIKERI